MVFMPLIEQVNRYEIPETLVLRNQSHSVGLFVIVAVCFVLIAVSKIINSQVFSFYKLFTNLITEKSTKQSIRLNSLSSILLLLNYFVSLALSVYLFLFKGLGWSSGQSILFVLLLLVLTFLIEVVALFTVQWLTNERKKIHPAIGYTLGAYQIAGVCFTLLNLFWLVNPKLNHFLVISFLIIIALKYLVRILKNSFIVLSNGVSLYYIILYFCTLEILPVFIAYIYIRKNFMN